MWICDLFLFLIPRLAEYLILETLPFIIQFTKEKEKFSFVHFGLLLCYQSQQIFIDTFL
jgi:hypothetical protein